MPVSKPLNEQTIVITGASSGIGAAGARELKKRGAKVVLVGRSATATREVAQSIGADYLLADFAKLSDVRALASSLLGVYPTIDVLINNAGGIWNGRRVTEDGHEMTFQVNYLAPFLLTALLQDRLNESNARIINTASMGNLQGRVNVDDLDSEKGFSSMSVYGTSKLENILHAVELNRRYGDKVAAVAFHPGVVATSWAREGSPIIRLAYQTPLKNLFLITPEKGAETMVWLATTEPGKDWQPGAYYDKPGHLGRLNPQASDAAVARALWDRSMAMIAPAGATRPAS